MFERRAPLSINFKRRALAIFDFPWCGPLVSIISLNLTHLATGGRDDQAKRLILTIDSPNLHVGLFPGRAHEFWSLRRGRANGEPQKAARAKMSSRLNRGR
jgi:hypothetical protein